MLTKLIHSYFSIKVQEIQARLNSAYDKHTRNLEKFNEE